MTDAMDDLKLAGQAIELAAEAAHEANRCYCRALGDNSQPRWDEAPQWQKDSAIAGAKAIFEDPDTTPEQSHEGWMRHKEAEGWVYGPVKDPEKKEHPCLLPYDQLPVEQRRKDEIFKSVVQTILISLGY
jgi:hypothetical protein